MIPNVAILLYRPGIGWADVSICVDQESSVEPTSAIEAPHETNTFVVPDVQLKINEGDASKGEFQRSWFATLTPESLDWSVQISVEGVVIFNGFVLPNTVQFDDVERWVSFTAIGEGGRLARTSAETSSLKRPTGTGWRVVSATGDATSAVVLIDKAAGPQYLCEFLSGDTISFASPGGDTGEAKIAGVAPVGLASPYVSWALTVVGLEQLYPALTVIDLLTPFKRNIPLKTVVDALFNAAGLGSTVNNDTYLVSPIANASAPFATAPNNAGLPGTPLGVAPNPSAFPTVRQYWPVVGTTSGAWRQLDSPLGSWTPEDGGPPFEASYPIDWTAKGPGTYLLYGQRYVERITATDEMTYTFYAYDYTSPDSFPATFHRWSLVLIVRYVNTGPGHLFDWIYDIYHETSPDGWTWGAAAGPYAHATGSTDTDINGEAFKTCGIEAYTADWLVFASPKVGSGAEVEYSISAFFKPTLTETLDIHAGRGIPFNLTASTLGVFATDTFRGNTPVVYLFRTDFSGFNYLTSVPIPADLVPTSIRRNPGDNFYYALAASAENGVRLLSFSDAILTVRAGWTPPVLYPPTPLYIINNVDLAVVKTGHYSGTGPYPMFGIFGNQLWWIAFSYAGMIDYANVEGMSCGDALAALATIVDGYFYVDADVNSWFRTRSTASSRSVISGTSATSMRLDDETCNAIRRASVWYKNYRHITVTNPDNDSILGEAGDVNFRGTEQALTIESRFITSDSFAQALSEHLLVYLGRALAVVDLERWSDNRRCEIGRTFTASILGVVKTLQIIEAADRPLAGTARLQALEM